MVSTGNVLSEFNAILPHASPSLDLPDELSCRHPPTPAATDWTMEQRSDDRRLNGVDLTVSEAFLSGSLESISRILGRTQAQSFDKTKATYQRATIDMGIGRLDQCPDNQRVILHNVVVEHSVSIC